MKSGFKVAFLLLTFTNPEPLNPQPVNPEPVNGYFSYIFERVLRLTEIELAGFNPFF